MSLPWLRGLESFGLLSLCRRSETKSSEWRYIVYTRTVTNNTINTCRDGTYLLLLAGTRSLTRPLYYATVQGGCTPYSRGSAVFVLLYIHCYEYKMRDHGTLVK